MSSNTQEVCYMVEYHYNLNLPVQIAAQTVSYCVTAWSQEGALERLEDYVYSGFAERYITVISQEEYRLFRDKQLQVGLWQVTRDSSLVMQALNKQLDINGILAQFQK